MMMNRLFSSSSRWQSPLQRYCVRRNFVAPSSSIAVSFNCLKTKTVDKDGLLILHRIRRPFHGGSTFAATAKVRSFFSTTTSNNNNNNSNRQQSVSNNKAIASSSPESPSSTGGTGTTTTTLYSSTTSTAYVHPLSQIILEYLQDVHHDWIVQHGLDQSLKLHRDGSFVLKFNNNDNNTPTTASSSSSSSSSTQMTNQDDDGNDTANDSDKNESSIVGHNETEDDTNCNKIWTSYDDEEKKHWLTVQKQSLHQRFLLQDNLLPAWHGNKKSLPERIHLSVDAMIRAVNRLDNGGGVGAESSQPQQRH